MRLAEAGELLARTFELFRRNWRLVFVLTLPIVVVVDGVTALGLGELTHTYRPAPPLRDAYIEVAAGRLVTLPLISAILARWIHERGRGRPGGAIEVLASGLEAFPAVLLGVAVWLIVSAAGFIFLIFPGIYTAVSWYFVAQAVVIDDSRGLASIYRSAAVIRGNWWRSFGVGVCFWLIEIVVTLVIGAVFAPLASSANAFAVLVVGEVIADAVTLPFLAIGATLYYLRLREAAATPRT